MYLQAKFGALALPSAGVLGTLALMFLSANATYPSESEMREALEKELDHFVTPGAAMRGVVTRDADRAEAIKCVLNSISRMEPFVVVFQDRGIDSDVWSGLVGSAQGELKSLVFDSSPSGSPQTRAEYFVSSRPCSNPKLAEVGYGVIRCAESEHNKPMHATCETHARDGRR